GRTLVPSGRIGVTRSVAAARESAAGAGTSSVAPALARLRLVDVDLPAADLAAVEGRDRLSRLARRTHLDEAEASRAAGVAVGDDGRRFARSHFREQRLELRAR